MYWLIAIVVLALLWLRQSLIVIIGITLLMLYALFVDAHAEYVLYDLWDALNRDALLAVPVFVVAHALMSSGVSAQRLTTLIRVLSSPLPIGLAIGSLLSMALVSTLCGSPAIGLLAVGPALHRALLADGYGASFSIGLLCSGAIIGVLLPLSVPLILYSAVSEAEISSLFRLAGVAALCLVLVLVVYSACTKWHRISFGGFNGDLRKAWMGALPAVLSVAVLVLALASSGLAPAYCGLLFLASALVAESSFYRALSKQKAWGAVQDSVQQLGRILPLVLFSVSLGAYLLYQQIPERLGDWLVLQDFGSGQFLGVVNFGLFITGLLLEAVPALLLVTPVLAPAAQELGLAPEPFGVMLVLNLSLGYLTPPNGLVLIAAMLAFRESFSAVLAAVVPFMAVLWAGVLALALIAQ